MRISLVNYRYFLSGGPEKYMFSIKKAFEAMGHSVIPFSVRSDKNVETEYSKYFVAPIGGENKTYFNEYKLNLKTTIQLLDRTFYSNVVKKALKKQIRNESIDTVYILHHINKLSPSVIAAAKEEGKRVVVRLSDFFLLCPKFDFLKNGDVCEACLKGSLLNGIKNNCVQNSKIASCIRVASMYFHRMIKIYNKVDYFVTPSLLLKNKLIEQGFNPEKIFNIPTFIDSSSITPNYNHQNYILYLGRLNREKGVEYVIRAMEDVEDKSLVLKVVGESSDDELKNIKQIIQSKNLSNVELLGFKTGDELYRLINEAKFTVVPSIWYDNMPNVILEAFAHGKPVIASNIGSLPEVVDDNVNGLLFKVKNSHDLADKINYLNRNQDRIVTYGKNAREKVEKVYNMQNHYNQLAKLLFPEG